MKRRIWLTGCTLMAYAGWAALSPRRVRAAAPPEQSPDAGSQSQFLPLFPLGIVAFPGELVRLHIFEPRYKQLIAESADGDTTFGIVTVVPGGASSVGTEMRFDRLLGVDDTGAMDIATRGIRAFQLNSFQRVVQGKLYSGGQVSFDKNDPTVEPELEGALVQLYNRLQYRSGSRKQLAAPYAENLSFLIGHDVGLSQAQELQLLTMSAEYKRQAYLFQHLLRTQ